MDREGGYVNDPNDPGGETKFGISKRQHPTLNIRELSRQRAHEIYLQDYYIPAQVSIIPETLREIYFDMVVHMGQKRAIRILQNAIANKGRNVRVDGVLGPNTIALLGGIETDRVRAFRILYYADLVIRRASLMRYWYGWYRRAVAC